MSTESLACLAKEFARAAALLFSESGLLPAAGFPRYLRVGSDYPSSLLSIAEFAALERAIDSSHGRFAESEPLSSRDFARSYMFDFVQAFVALAATRGESPLDAESTLDEVTSSLVARVEDPIAKLVAFREAFHVTTETGEAIQVGGVEVYPISVAPHQYRATRTSLLNRLVPWASTTLPDDFVGSSQAMSIIAVRGEVDGRLQDRHAELTHKLENFLLTLRLLTNTTAAAHYEVRGEEGWVQPGGPHYLGLRGDYSTFSVNTMVGRTARVPANFDEMHQGLAPLIASATPAESEVVTTSVAVALGRFQLSYHRYRWDEQLLDLATGLEAAFGGDSNADIALRLRSRAAGLLWTPEDSSETIFDDLGALYSLRSKVVHGAPLTSDKLARELRKVSAVSDGPAGFKATAQAMDRMRDLLRRAILARLCLAWGSEAVWPLDNDSGVDKCFANHATLESWYSRVRQTMESRCIASALEPSPAPAV